MQTFEWILILLVSAGFAYRDLILLVAFCVVARWAGVDVCVGGGEREV